MANLQSTIRTNPFRIGGAVTLIASIIIFTALLFAKGRDGAVNYAWLFAGAVVLFYSYKTIRRKGKAVDEELDDRLQCEVKWVGNMIPQIIEIDNCQIIKSGKEIQMELVARVNPNLTVKEGHNLAQKFEHKLRSELPNIGSISIRIEPFIERSAS